MPITIPYNVLASGSTVQTATANEPKQVKHQGSVLFAAKATGSGTWSITLSYTAYLATGDNDPDVRTVTVTNATSGGIATVTFATAAGAFRGWISAVSGTVSGTLSVEGN